MKKTYMLLTLSMMLCLSGRAKTDIIKSDFTFAGKQFDVAMKDTEKIIADQPEADKAKRPLVAPRSIEPDGKLIVVPSRDWTSGFFGGNLWYMYEYTKNPKWEAAARKYSDRIEPEKTNGTTHDMGFKVYCSIGNGYRLTKDPHYRDVLIESAKTLCTRFSPITGVIRSWDHHAEVWGYPVIIDNMLNLELLYYAFRETGDSTFYNIAKTHAITTMKNHFRPDYSTYHVVDYNPITGEVVKKNTHQGYAHESTWARGEAWAIYGFTMSYRETKYEPFLNQAQHVANFIFTNPNLPADLIPYWDYNAPNIPNEPRDASAAAVTASALYELSTYDKVNGTQYKGWADKIVENLSKYYKAKKGGSHGFVLLHSTGSKPFNSEVDVPLVYADYYFLEALLRKKSLETTGKLTF